MAKKYVSEFADFPAFQRHMDTLGMFHMRLGFDRMQKALSRLPMARPSMALAQVVGTNGKGSTSFFLSQLAQEHGVVAGLFTSPHFLTFRERIRINGRPALPSQILDWANTVQHECADLGLTYFETMALVAMVGFSKENVNLVVLEAGLGGRNDATSAWDPDLLLITPIGLDHEQIIGPGLERIARDKAGAIKTGSTVISAPQDPVAWAELENAAAVRNANLVSTNQIPNSLVPGQIRPALPGAHQIGNARLALAGWNRLCAANGWTMNPEACRRALNCKAWPGRLQRIVGPPEIILDGAHNPPALEVLAAALEELDLRPSALIFTCLQDKNLAAMAPLVRALTSGPIFVPELPTYQRTRPAAQVCHVLGPRAHAVQDAAAALREVELYSGPVLVCGSLYLLAEVYAVHPEWLEIGISS